MMVVEEELALQFGHHVVEHLGLKLYQNKPSNVLAELISNSWDADAKNVWLELSMISDQKDERFIVVADDGHGMTINAVKDDYLIIGKPKRGKDNANRRSPMGRAFMGRKGIGKLAPFGIARLVEVVTVTGKSPDQLVTWFQLDLTDILSKELGSGDPSKPLLYKPKIISKTAPLKGVDLKQDATGAVKQFLDRLDGPGTAIILRNLTLKKRVTESQIAELCGSRFTVTLLRDDFAVNVNSKPVEQKNALPDFEFRIPSAGMVQETVGGKEIRYWVGFVTTAEWPQEQAGVGVYAHGKIAQDRPFFFQARGGELLSRYMYGVVEADWLDDLSEDVISTDRTSINWDQDDAKNLLDWGRPKVRSWLTEYERWRRERQTEQARKDVKEMVDTNALPKITEQERESIAVLLGGITAKIGKNEEAKTKVTTAIAEAWLHTPSRKLVKELWDRLVESEDAAPDRIVEIVDALREHAVPEALSLAVTFAQKAYALSLLFNFVHAGNETDLQHLIEKFPWIISPSLELLTANQTLKTVVKNAEDQGYIPKGRRSDRVAGVGEELKPDFVFLSNLNNDRIEVIELKNPKLELTLDNREQLSDYLTYLEKHYPSAKLHGYLIGTKPGHLPIPRTDMTVRTWEEVIRDSRHGHIKLLGSMLKFAPEVTDDARLDQLHEFGGEKTMELLAKVAEKDEELKALFSDLPFKKLSKAADPS